MFTLRLLTKSSQATLEHRPSRVRWRRRFFALLVLWLLSEALLSHPAIRGLVAAPLVVHDQRASGEVAYVMAEGVVDTLEVIEVDENHSGMRLIARRHGNRVLEPVHTFPNVFH